MAVLSSQFYGHEKGNHDETFYYLARDTDSGRVFVIHEWYNRANVGSAQMTVADFLAKTANSSASGDFLRFIGQLATTENRDHQPDAKDS